MATLPALETPLAAVVRDHGARMALRHDFLVAAHFGSVAAETAVCLRSVGLADRFGLAPPDGAHAALGLIGPCAAAVLRLAQREPFTAAVRQEPDAIELLVPLASAARAWTHLLRAGRPYGIACVGFDALEHLAVRATRVS